jgi:hypothetical protein
MQQVEELRKTVTREEIEHDREALKAKPKKRPGAGVRAPGAGAHEATQQAEA